MPLSFLPLAEWEVSADEVSVLYSWYVKMVLKIGLIIEKKKQLFSLKF